MSDAKIKITGLTEQEVEDLMEALGNRGWTYDEDITTVYGGTIADHWLIVGVEVYNPTDGIRVMEAIELMREGRTARQAISDLGTRMNRTRKEKVCEFCGVALNPLELEESHFCKTTVGDVMESGIFGRPEDK